MARIAFAILRSKTVYREITTACNEMPAGVCADGEELRRTRLSLNSDEKRLSMSRFAPESALSASSLWRSSRLVFGLSNAL
jgi:hypothetical protein